MPSKDLNALNRRRFIQRLGAGASAALMGSVGLTGCANWLTPDTPNGKQILWGRPQGAQPLSMSGEVSLALDDLVSIIKTSLRHYGRIHPRLRSEAPTAAWYDRREDDLALAAVVFDLEVRPRPDRIDQFVVLPYAVAFVEHVSRVVVDVAVGTVQPNLKQIHLDFFEHGEHGGVKRLHGHVTQALREAKRRGPTVLTGPENAPVDIPAADVGTERCAPGAVVTDREIECGGGGCNCCCRVCGGYVDSTCMSWCGGLCCAACSGSGPARVACCAGCMSSCSLLCYVPTYCCGCCC